MERNAVLDWLLTIAGAVIAAYISSRITGPGRGKRWLDILVGGVVAIALGLVLFSGSKPVGNVTTPTSPGPSPKVPTPPPPKEEPIYLTDISPYFSKIGTYVVDKPMTIGGVRYSKGVLTRASSWDALCSDDDLGEVRWNLAKAYASVEGKVGLDDSYNRKTSTATFYGDGVEIGSYTLKPGDLEQTIQLPLDGVSVLKLTITGCARVDFVNMRLSKAK
ncbi:MAG: NPCBM/NEW2 domain-containing protein [Bacillota bacterium]